MHSDLYGQLIYFNVTFYYCSSCCSSLGPDCKPLTPLSAGCRNVHSGLRLTWARLGGSLQVIQEPAVTLPPSGFSNHHILQPVDAALLCPDTLTTGQKLQAVYTEAEHEPEWGTERPPGCSLHSATEAVMTPARSGWGVSAVAFRGQQICCITAWQLTEK